LGGWPTSQHNGLAERLAWETSKCNDIQGR
jgi:hypothetical protein